VKIIAFLIICYKNKMINRKQLLFKHQYFIHLLVRP